MAGTMEHPGVKMFQRAASASVHKNITQLVRAWVLVLPLLFLAAHGQFSFTQSGRNVDGAGSLMTADMSTSSEDTWLVRFFVYFCYGIVLYLCASRAKQVRRALWLSKPVVLLAVLALGSVLWSQQPVASLRAAVYYSLDTLLGIYLLSTFAVEEIMTLLMMTGVAVAFCTLLMVAFFPEYGLVQWAVHHGAWQGIFSDENDAGKNLVFLLTPVLNRQIVKLKNLLYAAVLLGLIYKTGSKTAVVALAVVIVFALCRGAIRRLEPKTAKFVCVLMAVVVCAGVALTIGAWTEVSALLGRDSTLTGRTDIWTLLVHSAEARPLLGYGYAAFWTGMDGESGKVYQAVHWIFTYAHNGFLEVWLQLGFVGVGIVLVAMAQAARDAVRCAGRNATRGTDWLTMLLILTVVYNLDEGTLLFSRTLVSVLFVVVCFGLAKAVAERRVYAMQWVRNRNEREREVLSHA